MIFDMGLIITNANAFRLQNRDPIGHSSRNLKPKYDEATISRVLIGS